MEREKYISDIAEGKTLTEFKNRHYRMPIGTKTIGRIIIGDEIIKEYEISRVKQGVWMKVTYDAKKEKKKEAELKQLTLW